MYDQWKIIKKDKDGNKYEIRIIFRDKKFLIDDVGFIEKGKRKPVFISSKIKETYEYRELSYEGRKEYEMKKILELSPKSLLQEAVEDVWKSLKPENLTFN